VIRRQLGSELTGTVPVSLFSPCSALHQLLVGYKAAPSLTARHEWRAWLSSLLAEFLRLHLSCLAESFPAGHGLRLPRADPDHDGQRALGARPVLAVPVPSSSRPRASWAGEHPLVGLVGSAVAAEPRLLLAPILAKGPEPVGHLRADSHGFRVVAPIAGRRVLVLDDTYTSGARAQSAAASLVAAGAEVMAIVPIGRLIHPEHNRSTGALWAQQQRERFDPGRCAGPCRLAGVPAACLTRTAEPPARTASECAARVLGQQQPPEAPRRADQADAAKNRQVRRVNEEHRADHARVEAA
jgi:hypothetical protein